MKLGQFLKRLPVVSGCSIKGSGSLSIKVDGRIQTKPTSCKPMKKVLKFNGYDSVSNRILADARYNSSLNDEGASRKYSLLDFHFKAKGIPSL